MLAGGRSALVMTLLMVRAACPQEPTELLAAGPATCGAAGDLDGDGDLELVVGQEDHPLVVLENDGKGAFAPVPAALPTPEGRARALALLDVDGDGDLDILVGSENDLTRLWSNEGGLRFVEDSARLPVVKLWVTAIVSGDLDGDGDTDAVLGNFAGASAMFRNERGRMTLAEGSLPPLRTVTALALADLDGDGDLDLVVGQTPDALGRGGRDRAARNDGRGKFTDATEDWMATATTRTTALALADLDGDGGLDLVCANRGQKAKEGARNGVHRRGSDGRFLSSARSRYDGAPAVSQAVALGDVDGDGDVDILFGNDGPERLYLNDGTGVFQGSTAFPEHDDDTRAVLLADLDGDRDLDVVTVNHGGPVRRFVNGGAGNFTGGSAPAAGPVADEGPTASPSEDLAAVAAGKYASRALARSAIKPKTGARDAIDAALRFLSDHQGDAGGFKTAAFVGGEFGDPPLPATHDVGVTGLALLSFLAEASHPGGGFYTDNVQRGVRWLVQQQQADGKMGPGDGQHGIYDHAIATLALAEAHALSGDATLRAPVQKALAHIEARRNPDGGFRYDPAQPPSDTSVTVWCALAQIAGHDCGLSMPAGAAGRTIGFLRSMTDSVTGRTGYDTKGGLSSRLPGEPDAKFPRDQSEGMTGAALFVRLALGEDPAEHADMRSGLALLAAAKPRKDESFDPYAWFHMAHALSQLGGDEWTQWRRGLHEVLVARQRRSGDLVGSWDPDEPWGTAGGRFATTALATLALQAEYRFKSLVDPKWRRRVK